MFRRTLFLLAPVCAVLALLAAPSTASATTFVINDGGEQSDANLNDGVCATAGGFCTLTAAIQQFNNESVADPYVIHFGVGTVTLTVSTPIITQEILVDGCNGTIQATPCTTIDMTGAGTSIRSEFSNQIVRGIAFSGQDSEASGLSVSGQNSVVRGNWFGMDLAGVARPLKNSLVVNGQSITVGGTTPAERNVFANGLFGVRLTSDAESVTIAGNYFSTNANGVSGMQGGNAVGPLDYAIYAETGARDITVGGTLTAPQAASPECDGPCNVIGAAAYGIDVGNLTTVPAQLRVLGNYVGVDATGLVGLTAAAAGTNGILVGAANDVEIGNGTATGRNVIGGPWDYGVSELGTAGALRISGNYLGMDATATTRMSATLAEVRTRGSASAPTRVEGNRFTHSTASGSALLVEGGNTEVYGNTFGLGGANQSLALFNAIRISSTAALAAIGGVDTPNVICGSTGSAAIDIDGGIGAAIATNFIGTFANGGACPGAANHSGVLLRSNATGNSIATLDGETLHVTGTTNDAIVVSGAGSTGNTIQNVAASGIGGQVIDLGGAATGDGAGNAGGAAGGVLAPSLNITSTAVVSGSAAANSRVRLYSTTSAAGSPAQQLGQFLGGATASGAGQFGIVVGPPYLPIGSRIVALQTLADGTTSELTNAVALTDGTPPQTSVEGPSGPIPSTSPTFTLVSDELPATFQCRLLLGAVTISGPVACTSPYTVGPLAEGTYTLRVQARDQLDNIDTTPAETTFTVDTTAPDSVITSAPSGYIRATSATIVFTTVGEPAASFTCNVDAGAPVPCASPFTLNGLTQGAHTVDVRAADAAGNNEVFPARAQFTVDSVAPVVKIAGTAVKPDRKGRVSLKLTCVDVSRPCTGTMKLVSAAKVAVTPKRKVLVTFGAPKFAIISTSPATVVSFTLSKANRALLVKLRAVKVKVTIAVKDPGGNARTSPKVLTLRAK